MKTFEATMLKEISRMATKYMDLSEKLEKQLTELKLELLLAKKALEERDRGWEAHCKEMEAESFKQGYMKGDYEK